MVRKLDIDGDAQADLAGHGGEQRAVFVYQMDSYSARGPRIAHEDPRRQWQSTCCPFS
jgi:MOSC domain-containing protein YiiM